MNASFELLNDDEEDTMGEDDLGFFSAEPFGRFSHLTGSDKGQQHLFITSQERLKTTHFFFFKPHSYGNAKTKSC